MKRFFILSTVLAVTTFSLVSCDKKTSGAEPAPQTEPTETVADSVPQPETGSAVTPADTVTESR